MLRWTKAVILVFAAACGSSDEGHGEIVDISISPLALVPSFSPAVHDYAVWCQPGETQLELTITDTERASTETITLAENELYSVRDQYFIRCLPNDFPALGVTRFHSVGAPPPGWYLVNSTTFAIVLDERGTPVWYRRGSRMIDIDSPRPNVISFMPNAEPSTGFTTGHGPRYEVMSLETGDITGVAAVGVPTDLHELELTPEDTYLVLSYPIVPHVDLTGLGDFGADETIADCLIQEVSSSGALLWSWRAMDHLYPRESLVPLTGDLDGVTFVDLFHCNAIELGPNNDVLLTMRHANAVFDIDRTSGQIRWKLGGTPSYKDGAPHLEVVDDPLGTFSMQHDARFLPNGNVTLFDNHGSATGGFARGVEYALDVAAGTARFVSHLPGPAPSAFMGSFRRTPEGGGVVSWGAIPGGARLITEFDPTGSIVFEVWTRGEMSYRGLKFPFEQFDVDLLRATAGGE